MVSSTIAALCIISNFYPALAFPAELNSRATNNSWGLTSFKSLVAFGDSYTDQSRLSYFASHNGSEPPVGRIAPVVSHQDRTALHMHLNFQSVSSGIC